MTGKNLEIISQIVLWYENSFRIDCEGCVSVLLTNGATIWFVSYLIGSNLNTCDDML